MGSLRFLYQFKKIKGNHLLNDFWLVRYPSGIYHYSFKLSILDFTLIVLTLLINFGK